VLSEVWGKGSKGGIELAKEVMRVADKEEKDFRFAYDEKKSITEKIHILATRVYGAEGVDYVGSAAKQVDELEALGFGQLPVCVAKTQYSLSDDPQQTGEAHRFPDYGQECKSVCGCWFRRGAHRGYHDNAGTAESACCRVHRRG
jgi:formate--tetrahydrofolate ligase